MEIVCFFDVRYLLPFLLVILDRVDNRYRRVPFQSTSDLVAQLTSNLPESMHIEGRIREHEERVRREQEDAQVRAVLFR